MIAACFRHQHPEAFRDCAPPAEGDVPPGLRFGPGDSYEAQPAIPEEPMGQPVAIESRDSAEDAAGWA